MNPFISAIRAEAGTYGSYLRWKDGGPLERGVFMAVARKNWELYGASYRVNRRKLLNIA